MSFDKKIGECICERCGHCWLTYRTIERFGNFIEPKSCAKCKSKVWNQLRVYAGKYISGTLAKRFKPTGRAAAKTNSDPEVKRWKEIAQDPEKDKYQKYDAILETLEPEERCAATKQIMIWELSEMLEELGLK